MKKDTLVYVLLCAFIGALALGAGIVWLVI